MENEFALELKKQKSVTEYKSALISAINLMIDNIKSQQKVAESLIQNDNLKITENKIKGFQKSIKRFSDLKNKIENNINLSKAEYSLLALICIQASHNVSLSAQRLVESAEQLQNLAKAFMI